MKTHLLHGAISGLLAGIAGVIYLNIYQELYLLDFSLVVNAFAIISSSIIGCILMGGAYFLLEKLKKEYFKGVLNILFMIISFSSIIPVMTMALPLEIEFPELFPGLVIPIHFFPAMTFFGLAPFFVKKG